ERSHSGKYCYGKTPMQTFLDSKHIAIEKSNESMYYNNTSDSRNLSDYHL
ncbi:MAG: IS481 family transposase, partial [Rickettsiaceae bacterium]|nr:IS481 family transposase [Rickettsiaceae bacterium]